MNQGSGGGPSGSNSAVENPENLVSACPSIAVLMGGVSVPCLVGTGSMVSTVTESFFVKHFEPWGPDKLRSCNWLRLSAANGLSIPYVGYLELDVQLCGRVVTKRGVLVVKDPPYTVHSVPGVLPEDLIPRPVII